jgi:hypothetical protein
MVDFTRLDICSPKRNSQTQQGWAGFFPYYAGYPEVFAERLLASANIRPCGTVLDPWNGSGTTTYTASRGGFESTGIDLNPVMGVVARARVLAATESDCLMPLSEEILAKATRFPTSLRNDDPLLDWFGPSTASWIRRVEEAAREILVGADAKQGGDALDSISSIASTYYVALFVVCREVAYAFQSSNPTWLRKRKPKERRASWSRAKLEGRFRSIISEMSAALMSRTSVGHCAPIRLLTADTASELDKSIKADLVLTSPPYCTRLDYTAATRLQLAVLFPLLATSPAELSRRMTGSVRVPVRRIDADDAWGPTCNKFLRSVTEHKSKASAGYYAKTHLDYFSKIYRSLDNISSAIRPGGAVIMVVQDSYYKDIHNDLPTILTEMGAERGLILRRRDDFTLNRSLADRHPHTRRYRPTIDATESVLCFERSVV